jgi:hypothetical protein
MFTEETEESVQWSRGVPRVPDLMRSCGDRSGVSWSDWVWLDMVSGSWCDLPGGPRPLLRVSSVDLWRRHSLIRVVVDGCGSLGAPFGVVIEAASEDRALLDFALERSRGRCRIVEVRWRHREGARWCGDRPICVSGLVQK